jgi:hypothetical protein
MFPATQLKVIEIILHKLSPFTAFLTVEIYLTTLFDSHKNSVGSTKISHILSNFTQAQLPTLSASNTRGLVTTDEPMLAHH